MFQGSLYPFIIIEIIHPGRLTPPITEPSLDPNGLYKTTAAASVRRKCGRVSVSQKPDATFILEWFWLESVPFLESNTLRARSLGPHLGLGEHRIPINSKFYIGLYVLLLTVPWIPCLLFHLSDTIELTLLTCLAAGLSITIPCLA